jgi:hypothetical protein
MKSMTNSTLIARLMGPVLLIMGVGSALGLLGVGIAAGDYTSVMREMANPALTILVGILTLVVGRAIVNRLFLLMGAATDLSPPVPREKALHSELPKPTGIGHSIGHQVQKLSPNCNPQLTIPGVIAKGIIRL